MGHVVPFHDEDDDGNPTGYCYGLPPDQDTLDSAIVDDHSAGVVPSVADYVGRLKKVPLIYCVRLGAEPGQHACVVLTGYQMQA
jgi:hypothetical protein